jgi:hypothetical protein
MHATHHAVWTSPTMQPARRWTSTLLMRNGESGRRRAMRRIANPNRIQAFQTTTL